jgi:hypothetical protein
VNVVLPANAQLHLSRGPGERTPQAKIRVEFGEPWADSLVGLRVNKQFFALQEVCRAAQSHDQLLPYAAEHPGAATLFGYALLRAGELSTVETALGRIPNRGAMEPDATILLAECAARAGGQRSGESFDLFIKAAGSGIPSFSPGLSYLVERLRLFAQCEPSDERSLPGDVNERARAALAKIEPYSIYADYTRLFTCYSGLTPIAPNANKISKSDFDDAKGRIALLA